MATTNWELASEYQGKFPHTFNALQHLVQAMAAFANKRGRKTFFGKDAGLVAFHKFEETFRDTLLAMVLDGMIERNSAPLVVRKALIDAIEAFSETFPNWQDAYAFATEFLVDSAASAEDRIQSVLR